MCKFFFSLLVLVAFITSYSSAEAKGNGGPGRGGPPNHAGNGGPNHGDPHRGNDRDGRVGRGNHGGPMRGQFSIGGSIRIAPIYINPIQIAPIQQIRIKPAIIEIHRPYIVIFGSSGCDPCKKLKGTIFATSTYVELSKTYKVVYVDVDTEAGRKQFDLYCKVQNIKARSIPQTFVLTYQNNNYHVKKHHTGFSSSVSLFKLLDINIKIK